ncbi:hypothetical protein [Gimesia fumaroli]|uniref:Secreted protein n=1 Tax=Gimesia fumaroli TaxID=2527976 RepID=A0A518IIZ2_9PLAN|nr:hypothetical protein [Gimesia fumaroli]QDV53035.1 hypothetical protein Enr17x_51050 [Gimesia fumaroli]
MSRYAVLATILCLTSISTAQDKKAEDVAKKNTAPDGYIESLPGGIPTDAQEPEDRTAKTAGFGWYNNCGVNIPTTLNGTNGTTKISVYARDVSWWFARGGRKIRNVQGDGGAGGSGWRFPNAHKFGVVIYQGNSYWNVNSTSSSSPTVINLPSNTLPVTVWVNDTNGNYSDNAGAVDIYLRKDN